MFSRPFPIHHGFMTHRVPCFVRHGIKALAFSKGRDQHPSKSLQLEQLPLYKMQSLTLAFVLSAVVGQTLAICAGFNYAIGHQQNLGGGVSRCTFSCLLGHIPQSLTLGIAYAGQVYDDSCNPVDSLTTTGNPCTSGTFSCSPPPIIFNGYTNTFSHLQSVLNSGALLTSILKLMLLVMHAALTPALARVAAMSSRSA